MRRRWLVGVAAAVAVTASVGGAALLLGGDEPATDETRGLVEAATTTAAPLEDTAADAAADATTIEWQQVALPDAMHLDAIIPVDGRFHGFGSDDSGIVAWESADGLTWERVPVTGDVPATSWFRSYTWTGTTFVAIGENSGPDHVGYVATSADGRAWQVGEVAFPPPAIEDELIQEYPQLERIAVGANGGVAIGTVHRDLAIDSLLPDEYKQHPFGVSFGYGAGSGDVEVTDEDGNVVFAATLEELGVPAETLAQLERHTESRPLVWRSTDLVTWERADAAFGTDVYLYAAAATDSGFAVLGDGPEGPSMWTSTDGRNWEFGGSPITGYVNEIQRTPAGLLAVGGGPGGPQIWQASDFTGDWRVLSTGPAFEPSGNVEYSISHAAVGGAGYVAVGEGYEQPPFPDVPPVVVEHDGKAITFIQTEDAATTVVTDLASGDELARIVYDFEQREAPEAITVDDEDNLVITDPASGDVVAVVPNSLVAAAHDEVFDEIRAVEDDAFVRPEMVVWYSADGAAWQRWDMLDALGVSGYPMALAVADDRIVLAVQPEPEWEGDQPPAGWEPLPVHVFVGTPGGSS